MAPRISHSVLDDSDVSDFHAKLPDMHIEYPFELDPFQKRAILHIHEQQSVFAAAATSAGKTILAEYAIATAVMNGGRAVYTSPIKALSNQKYRDFKEKFGDVGIVTGDVRVNAEAACVIMTTEILRTYLYRSDPIIQTLKYVVFDEIHWLNDAERGLVYEECLILLPPQCAVVMLSATVPNYLAFADWVGRIRGCTVHCVKTDYRPVPLKFCLYVKGKKFPITNDEDHSIDNAAIKAAYEQIIRARTRDGQDSNAQQPQQLLLHQLPSDASAASAAASRGGRGGHTGGRGGRGGRGGVSSREEARNAGGRGGRGGRGGGGGQGGPGRPQTAEARNKSELQRLYSLLLELSAEDLLPAVVFVFSRMRLEHLAGGMPALDLLTKAEKSRVHVAFKKALSSLSASDRELPQIKFVTELAMRGVGVHHGGLLPVVKELTEILFQQNILKVLFATETISVGLNLPTRTAVFSALRKHDGDKHRYLLPTEFLQMSGRAGRRGLDTQGNVYLFVSEDDKLPEYQDLLRILSKRSTELKSQFRITYEMLLHLKRLNHISVQDVMKNSFLEAKRSLGVPLLERELKSLTAKLVAAAASAAPQLVLAGCEATGCTNEGVNVFMALVHRWRDAANALYPALAGRKELIKPGRLCWFLQDAPRQAVVTAPVLQGKFRVFDLQTRTTCAVDVLSLLLVCDGFALSPDAVELEDERFRLVCFPERLSLGDLEKMETLTALVGATQATAVLDCENLQRHALESRESVAISRRIAEIEHQLSEGSMRLVPQLKAMETVLEELQYVESENKDTLTMKGKTAVEILNADELTLVECLFEGIIHADMEISELVAIVTAFVAGNDNVPQLKIPIALKTLPASFVDTLDRIARLHYERVGEALKKARAEVVWEDFDRIVCFGLAPIAYHWTRKLEFSTIMADDALCMPDGEKRLQEGTIARSMVRTDELLRKIAVGAKVMNNAALETLIEKARDAIRRDIAFGLSLYIKDQQDSGEDGAQVSAF